jgi:hypothetical protein
MKTVDKTIIYRLWAIQVKLATGWIEGLSKKQIMHKTHSVSEAS